MMKENQEFKNGGVSMFLVIVASSLIVLIAASFMRLTVRDQSQASNQDLSQSAYDSAQTGVEDAKRYMTKYAAECASGYDLSKNSCQKMKESLESHTCNTLYGGGSGVNSNSTGETLIRTNTGEDQMNQAYTCVKITQNTPDFIGKTSIGQPRIIPIRGESTFRKVRLSWHTREDMSSPDQNISLDTLSASGPSLLSTSDYATKINRPAVIKAQFYGYTPSMVNLDDFDTNFSDNGNGLNEQIYYPVSGTLHSEIGLPKGDRRTGLSRTRDLSLVSCKSNMNSGSVYACSLTIDLGHDVQKSHSAFIRLTPFYKSANFKVELLDSTGKNIINFDGVQPKVDSTGRANDQLRRVESRIEFVDQTIPVPDFALQLEDGSKPLCKDFWVTNLRNNIPSSCK